MNSNSVYTRLKKMETYEYVKKFKTLITREQDAEKNLHTQEIKTLSPNARQKKGRCLTALEVQHNPKLEADSIFRFVRVDNTQLPPNEFSIGANVIISKQNPLETGLQGIITNKTQMSIDVYISSQSNMLHAKNLQIDLFVNDATYQAQLQILQTLKDWNREQGNLRDILLHQKKPTLNMLHELSYLDTTLNDSQKLAVKYALAENEIYLIQGPPGTGKTKTSIEIIRQCLRRGQTVLVSADSNMAVDNIMLGLLPYVSVIRLGNSPKILPEIQEHTLEKQLEQDIEYTVVEQGLNKIAQLRKQQRECVLPNKKNSFGLSHFQIRKLAERGQSDFGISKDDMRSMAQWIKLNNELKEIQKRVFIIKEKIIARQIESASVICTTNTNAVSDVLQKKMFDVVLIDEAGQSTEPSCLLPISKGKKIILVGDHKQLPPTILSPDAKELSISLFERMFTNTRNVLLDTQYRMHPLINEFPSNEFYNGQLQSAKENEEKKTTSSLFTSPLVFIESFGEEKKYKGATSYYNTEEQELLFSIVSTLTSDSDDESIGIISPYNEQVKQLRDQLLFVEVNSIDGFQGREKEVILMSLVRSNKKGELGFLKDLRRLNVAITRAQKQLIIIGNPKTISNHEVYKRLIEHIQKHGQYISAKDANTLFVDA